MSELDRHYRLAEIEVTASGRLERIVGVFRYESDVRRAHTPIVLLLVDIASTLYVYEQLLDALNVAAEQARHQLAGVESDPMARFEKLVQRLNEAVARFLEHEPTAITWNRVNLYAVELSESHICLTGIGHLCSLFLQKQPDQHYRAFDLFGSLEQPETIDPNKPFTSLICGDLHPGDILFAGTRNFESIREELRLVERLKTLPAVSAALEIQQDLEHGDVRDDFSGLIIAQVELPARSEASTEPVTEPLKESSTESVKKMERSVRATEAALAPALTPLPHTTEQTWKERFQNIFDEGARRVHAVLKRRHDHDLLSLNNLRGMNAGYQSKITRQHTIKIALGIAGILMIVGGIFWYQAMRRNAAEQALWNASYDQILDREHRAEADLVYQNEADARSLVQEGEHMLASLDGTSATRQAAKAKLADLFNAVEQHLRHINAVDNPVSFTVSTTSDDTIDALTVSHQHIYAGTAQGHLFDVDVSANSIAPLPATSANGSIQAITGDATRVLILQNNHLFALTPAGAALSEVAFVPSSRVSSTTALQLYTGKLYLLDAISGMIWKFPAHGTGFGKEQAYLKQPMAELQQAADLAIDSNVYVALNQGSLLRFLSGNPQTWKLQSIDPPLTSIAHLWTDLNSTRIVVTDPANRRVLVFNKDGSLNEQITSNNLQHPNNVTVDPTAKKIYVSDTNHILVFDLP